MARINDLGTPTKALLALSLLCATSAAQSTSWTVDDDQSANFSSITSAIASTLVKSGDRLLVQPGTYAPFNLTGKRLSILGPGSGPAPHITGSSSVSSVNTFTLAGLSLEGLKVSWVSGLGQIDDCVISRTQGDLLDSALEVTSCSQLLIMRTTVEQGPDVVGYELPGGFYVKAPAPAMSVTSSMVRYTNGLIRGGDQEGWELCFGQNALEVTASDMMLSCVSVKGGEEIPSWIGPFGSGGYGGDAIVAENSTLVFRGSSTPLQGGWSKYDPIGDGVWTKEGHDIVMENSHVVCSGYAIADGSETLDVKALDEASTFQTPAQPEPFIELLGSDVPGESRRLLLHGPSGALAFLVTSLGHGMFNPPGFDGLCWLNPGAFILTKNMVAQGHDTPVGFNYPPLPPALIGATIISQAAFPGIQSTLNPGFGTITNPASIIARF